MSREKGIDDDVSRPLISPLVSFRQKRCELVDTFVTTYREEVAEALELLLRDDAGEGEPPLTGTMADLLERLLRRMRSTLRDLLEAEQRHLDERGNDSLPRKRRDQATAELKQALFHLRGLYRAAYGDLIAEEHGFERRIANDSPALLRQGERVYGRLSRLAQTPEAEQPRPLFVGLGVSASAAAALLEPLVRELRETLAVVTREQARIQGTKVAKDRAMKLFDDSYRQVVRMLVPAFQLAGQVELAEKLPTSLRRPRRQGTSTVNAAPAS